MFRQTEIKEIFHKNIEFIQEIFTFTLDDKLFTVLVSILDDCLLKLICGDGSKAVCECLLVSDCFVDRN